MPRRFFSPWTAERIPGGYVVKDATGQAPTSMPARHAIRSVIEIVLQRAAVCSVRSALQRPARAVDRASSHPALFGSGFNKSHQLGVADSTLSAVVVHSQIPAGRRALSRLAYGDNVPCGVDHFCTAPGHGTTGGGPACRSPAVASKRNVASSRSRALIFSLLALFSS